MRRPTKAQLYLPSKQRQVVVGQLETKNLWQFKRRKSLWKRCGILENNWNGSGKFTLWPPEGKETEAGDRSAPKISLNVCIQLIPLRVVIIQIFTLPFTEFVTLGLSRHVVTKLYKTSPTLGAAVLLVVCWSKFEIFSESDELEDIGVDTDKFCVQIIEMIK